MSDFTLSDLKNMKLHELKNFTILDSPGNELNVIRVPNGWLYKRHVAGAQYVFVPEPIDHSYIHPSLRPDQN